MSPARGDSPGSQAHLPSAGALVSKMNLGKVPARGGAPRSLAPRPQTQRGPDGSDVAHSAGSPFLVGTREPWKWGAESPSWGSSVKHWGPRPAGPRVPEAGEPEHHSRGRPTEGLVSWSPRGARGLGLIPQPATPWPAANPPPGDPFPLHPFLGWGQERKGSPGVSEARVCQFGAPLLQAGFRKPVVKGKPLDSLNGEGGEGEEAKEAEMGRR